MMKNRSKMRMSLYALTAFLLLALLAGCGGGGGKQEPAGDGGGQSAGGDANYEQAMNIFKSNCVSCHANDLSGNMGGNTNLQKVGGKLSKDEIVKVIAEGRGIMPAFSSSLSDDEIEQLADWLSTKK